jgi:hypothetical protein
MHAPHCDATARYACRYAFRLGRYLFLVFLFLLLVFTGVARARTPDWGQDILVGSVVGEPRSICKLTTDSDTNGDIYVGVLVRDSARHDTIRIWQSKDGRDPWVCAYCLPDDSHAGPISDYEVRVGGDAAGTWMYDFLVLDDSGATGGLWMLRHRVLMVDRTWVRVASGGDTILRLAADRNTESPEHLFVAWETQGGLINLASSSDSGQTWSNLRTAFVDCERPALCAGGDGCVYVAANTRDSASIVVARYSANLSNPTPVTAKLDSGSDRRVWNPSIAADRSAPESMQTAIVMYSYRDTAGKITPHFGWTTTGGLLWSSTVWPATNQSRTTWDARFPCVRRSYDDDLIRAVVTMHEPSKSWDTLVYAFARPSTPTVWEDRGVRNEIRASDIVGAKMGFSEGCIGGYATYVEYGVNKIFFDCYRFVGMSEPSRPVTGYRQPAVLVRGDNVSITLQLDHAGDVRIRAYDCAGRVVACLYNAPLSAGAHELALPLQVPGGCWLLRIETPGCAQTCKLVIAR